ncbi:MAG: hypothetical protein L0211_18855 [Planctomycetaceae bacterium]|nr:hypothetical protein [Planctomycetaceae bacterium]
MKFTVVSTPFADYQLGEIWLRAANPQDVSDASDRIDALLKNDAQVVGEQRPDGLRAVVPPPLTVTFEVSVDDRKATIVSVRYTP